VTKREDLETALAKAEAAREHLEATLANAEAALVSTVTDAAKIDANLAEANAKVDKARARCRQLRAALVQPGHSKYITRSRARIDTLIKKSGEIEKREATANPPSRQPGQHAVRGVDKQVQNESGRTKEIPKDAIARRSLIRQTVGLVALTLAYLQYYFLGVQLQILSLPSVFPGPLQ
jgi:hypothetical protein